MNDYTWRRWLLFIWARQFFSIIIHIKCSTAKSYNFMLAFMRVSSGRLRNPLKLLRETTELLSEPAVSLP